MKSSEILKFLSDNDLEEVEEIQYKDNMIVVRFYYDFDKAELDAAKAYANEESDYDEESQEWLKESFIPYLSDLAIDTVGEILEDTMEEFEVEGQYVAYDIDIANYTYNQIIAVFSKEDEFDIDEIMGELNL